MTATVQTQRVLLESPHSKPLLYRVFAAEWFLLWLSVLHLSVTWPGRSSICRRPGHLTPFSWPVLLTHLFHCIPSINWYLTSVLFLSRYFTSLISPFALELSLTFFGKLFTSNLCANQPPALWGLGQIEWIPYLLPISRTPRVFSLYFTLALTHSSVSLSALRLCTLLSEAHPLYLPAYQPRWTWR